MTEIVGIKFKKSGKTYYFDPKDAKIRPGEFAVVETAIGVELGECTIGNKEVDDNELVSPLKPVIRVATKEDLETEARNVERAKEAMVICGEKIKKHNLNMKLIDAEYTFDNTKVLFYFISDNRVDFRELVKDLASVFKTRIELRQIGVRDKAKTVGGLGVCGRILCCASNAAEFQPVTIKMAKEQGLSLSPTKISGVCGRLMCCLKYEQEAYEDAIRRVPGTGSIVKTPNGKGTVIASNLLKETVSVKYNDDDSEPETYKISEIEIIKKENSKAAPSISMGDDGDLKSIMD